MTREAEEAVDFVFTVLASILMCIAGLLISAGLAMTAWNMAMPHLFALPEASYRNAFGMVLLIRVSQGGLRWRE